MRLRHLPNLVSSLRLVCSAAIVVVVAAGGTRPWFLGLLAVALLSDAVDGPLARRLNAVSDLGRRIDSWGDYAMLSAGSYGLWVLWPEVIHREIHWLVAGLASCYAIVIYGLVRHSRILAYHTMASKVLAVALPLAVAVLLAGWSAVPIHVVITLNILAAVEELAIAIVLPGFSGEMPSLWHAIRRRRQGWPNRA
jgi:phosphatidylglycerophosphate synthase